MAGQTKYSMYDEKCARLLSEDDIRFAGIVDAEGRLVSGGQREGLQPLESDESKLRAFIEFVSKISIRKEYDGSLGAINYLAARRDKVVLISFPFPISKIILLVSAEPRANIESLAKKVVDIFTGVR